MLRPKEMMQKDERLSLRESFLPNRINNTTMMRDDSELQDSNIRHSQAATMEDNPEVSNS